jgi:carboxymethylenebutenolidase
MSGDPIGTPSAAAADDVTSTTVDLSGPDAVPGSSPHLNGYLARPTGDGPWPGVVVMFEAFGLDDQMRRHADRLARLGYLTLVPDLYRDGGARRCLVATMRSAMSGRGRAHRDIETARLFLAGHPDSTGTVGSIGFCLGGSFALLSARTGFAAAAVNYGRLPKDVAAALAGACPIVGSYGGHDPGNRGAALTLADALERAGIVHDVREYPDAGHSFLNEGPNGPRLLRVLLERTGAGPHPRSAQDAWVRIDQFFATHLH